MDEMNREDAIATLESVTNPQEQQQPQEAQTQEEMLEYYLGDKMNKLPLSAMAAFKENNKINKVPFSQVINGYRMNAKTSKQNEELLRGKSQWDMTTQELKKYQEQMKSYEPYKQLQEWSQDLEMKDPVGFKYLMDTIDRVKNGTYGAGNESQLAPNAVHQTITELRQELMGLKEWKGQFDQMQEQKKVEEDTKFVNGEIQEIKKNFPEINLDEVDENQISLSTKVINFGIEKGYQNFTDAFRAFFWDKLPAIFANRGKNEAVGSFKKDYSKGILARSSTPMNGHPTKDNKNEMLQEFEALLQR